jgi:galacturonokinase
VKALRAPALEARAAGLRRELAARAARSEETVRIVRAPYRICPVGAHVDHQFGPVCALGLEHALLIAWLPVDDGHLTLASRNFPGTVRIPLDAALTAQGDWGDHARGAVAALRAQGIVPAGLIGLVDGAFGESGLSSSAAAGIAYLLALTERAGVRLGATALIRAQGSIEQDFLGLANGLLDPAAVVLAEAGALLRIDTRDLGHRTVRSAAAADVCFLAVSAGQREALVAGSRFNDRVAECRAAARLLAERCAFPDPAPRLGDLPRALLAEHGPGLPAPLARRARHFLTETERVDAALAAWERSDVEAFGAAMRASARSSIDDYETGSPPMVDLLRTLDALPGVHGARFSGAGFRGCCVALVDCAAAEDVAAEAIDRYARLRPELARDSFALASRPAAGAGPL